MAARVVIVLCRCARVLLYMHSCLQPPRNSGAERALYELGYVFRCNDDCNPTFQPLTHACSTACTPLPAHLSARVCSCGLACACQPDSQQRGRRQGGAPCAWLGGCGQWHAAALDAGNKWQLSSEILDSHQCSIGTHADTPAMAWVVYCLAHHFCAFLVVCRVCCHVHQFDVFVVALGVLANCVERDRANRNVLAKLKRMPSQVSRAPGRGKRRGRRAASASAASASASSPSDDPELLCQALVRLFLERATSMGLEQEEGSGAQVLSDDDVMLQDNATAHDAATTMATATATATASIRVEDVLCGAYLALLIGCVTRDHAASKAAVERKLPNNNYGQLVAVLRAFVTLQVTRALLRC